MKVKTGKGVGISVETGEITDGAVTAAKLATDAVETLKIKDLNVTLGKLAADCVDGTKIADAAIAIEHVPQTGRAANYNLKVNSGNTALEFGLATVDPNSNMTINGVTHMVAEWLVI